MKTLESKITKPKERFIKEYVCSGCNMTVTQKEMEIPIGPRKGEKITANFGCKCADIKLAEEAKKTRANLQNEKMKQFFDYYSLINESLKAATLENYEPTSNELATAKQTITDYIQEFDGTKNLLLVGNYGTGKSHLSVSVTKKLMEQGKECLFLSLPKLLTKIKETYNNKGVTEDELLEVIQRVDLLVLDDLGAEHKTEWAITKLFEILDNRAGKATIYTTNLDSKELRERMNERNFSRLMENTEVIKMNGRDYRRREF
ncbi:DNA replication protein DnaC [Lentibacillus populi]|uniref:DNA replication protein DnaC n=1 Tax=Lentibacillus populi TaxID=1827502 RepID=A0A9W5U2F0_9BACI|nr:ATP-binding protein [Lentibacillus populi]GGB61445.1 DNA replication protein DnaC [Lentibacillus populi]